MSKHNAMPSSTVFIKRFHEFHKGMVDDDEVIEVDA